jgi:hypothetical protein
MLHEMMKTFEAFHYCPLQLELSRMQRALHPTNKSAQANVLALAADPIEGFTDTADSQ